MTTDAKRTNSGQPMRLAWWRTSSKTPTRHITLDGRTTVCKRKLPHQAHVSGEEPQWHLKANCYNCARNLASHYQGLGLICPVDGKDFPPRPKCPHGRASRDCVRCTPSAVQNWPCLNGCTDPADHDPLHRYTKCTVHPPQREPSTEDGQCADQCETTDQVIHRANPGLHFDLADSASMTCYHCGHEVEGWWE